MTSHPKTCVVYCRVSTARQKEAETIQAQVERCTRLVERQGLQVLPYGPHKDGWLKDEGTTGTLLEGRLFAAFLDDLQARKIKPDALVVFSLSRISRVDKVSANEDKIQRSHADNARIVGTLIARKVSIIDEDGVNDPASIGTQVKMMLANEQYKLIRESTMAGKARCLSENKYARGGKPPYGYLQVPINGTDRRKGFTLRRHPQEAPNLVRILDWFCEGGLTFAARQATEARIPTPMSKTDHRKNRAKDWNPTRWSPVSVQHILRNARAYLGEANYVYNGQPYAIQYDPLIDLEKYAMVERRKKERTLKNKRAVFLTTGYVDCACGKHIHNHNSHGDHYTCCPRGCGSMRQNLFDGFVRAATICRLVQIRTSERQHATGDEQMERTAALDSKIANVDIKITKLVDAYLNGLDKGVYREKNDELNQAKLKLQTELNGLRSDQAKRAERKAQEQTLEEKAAEVFDELSRRDVPLARQRGALADLLGGARLVVEWKKGVAIMRLPAFGELPAVTFRTDRDVWMQFFKGQVAGRSLHTKFLGKGRAAAERAILESVEKDGWKLEKRRENETGDAELTFVKRR